MMFQMSLLDAMYMQTNCPCLSDLRRLHDWQKARLARSRSGYRLKRHRSTNGTTPWSIWQRDLPSRPGRPQERS